MAMSFTRPDPGNPAQIADATFSTSRRGFDQTEVRDFLQMVAAEMSSLAERVRFLEREVDAAQSSPEVSAGLDEETLTRLLGEETARVLNAARASAAEIREKAEHAAAQLVSEASDEAARVREEVDTEASRRRADAAADSEAELEMAKQQGREMVNEARAYRERVLSELSRRRELAREQIEQLVHGRDRLVDAFERARTAAVDVIADLEPLGEPDEYVDLTPTTGPVPVMVAREHEAPAGVDASAPTDAGETAEVIDIETRDVAHDTDAAEVTGADAAGAEAPDAESPDAETADDGGEAAVEAPVADVIHGREATAEVASPADTEPADTEPADTETETELADAETDTELADAETELADAETDTELADAETDTELADAETAETEPAGDVVVDLFARLRSETDEATDATDEDARASAGPHLADASDDDAVRPAVAEAVGAEPDVADTEIAEAVEAEPDLADTEAVDPAVAPFEQRDAELTPLIVGAARKLKRVLADEQNDVLDAIRTAGTISSLDDLVPVEPEHAGRYVDAISDDLLVAAQSGASSTRTDGVVTLTRKHARSSVDVAGDQLAERLVAVLRNRLERAISETDGDLTALTKKVRTGYREVKTQHIDDVLDDVFRTAYGAGQFAAIPAGESVVWICDSRYPCSADCEDNALSPPVAHGDPFPTGHTSIPAHPGCRCLLQIAPR